MHRRIVGTMPVSPRPVALVTGGAKRLGRSIASALARAGHDIALHFRSSRTEAEATAEALRESGARVELIQADLADEAQCEGLVSAAVQSLGRLDAIVHNASLFEYDDVSSFSYELME